MTAPKPLDLEGKTPEELRRMIRGLEQTYALQDQAAQEIQRKLAEMWLKTKKSGAQKLSWSN